MAELRSVTITLGEREYEVKEAPFSRSKPWKKRLLSEVRPVFEQLAGLPDMEFGKPDDLLQLLPVVEDLFLDGLDTLHDLLLAYSADLEADADYISDHASDRQILESFQEVLQLADPFGVIQAMNRQIGRSMIGTQSSLPSANGDSVLTKPGN